MLKWEKGFISRQPVQVMLDVLERGVNGRLGVCSVYDSVGIAYRAPERSV